MLPARPPKIAESAEQVGAADEQARRAPGVLVEPDGRGDQGEAAQEPDDRAEMQEQRHQPSDYRGCPPIVEKKRLDRSHHEPLGQDAVNHRGSASDDSRQPQGSVLPIHDHTPLYGTYGGELAGVNTPVYGAT
jgi:hypothetical protein